MPFRPALTDSCNRCHTVALDLPENLLLRCTRCRLACYCSPHCQKKAWKSHKRVCRQRPSSFLTRPPSSPVAGVRVMGGRNRPFRPLETVVPPTHSIWASAAVSPLSQLIGIPLLIFREVEEMPLEWPNDAEKDNTSVTFLMIDPEIGFAPDRWQKNIGPVTIVRADHKPLTVVALEIIWMFVDSVIISEFEDSSEPPFDAYSREEFDQFCQAYKEEQLLNKRRVDQFRALQLPL